MNINKRQVIIGLISLFLGFAVYIIRSPGHIYFVSRYCSCIQLADDILKVVKIVDNNLPDFIHPFAFILITSGLISLDNKLSQFFVCLGWFFVEGFFEFGQHFKESYLRFIPSWFDNIPLLDNTKYFFQNGTFDVIDMLSIFAGTVMAFCVLLITSNRGEKNEN